MMLKEMKKDKPRKHMSIVLNDEEREAIQKNADKYAAGNVSGWIRYCAMNYAPTKGELVEVNGNSKSPQRKKRK